MKKTMGLFFSILTVMVSSLAQAGSPSDSFTEYKKHVDKFIATCYEAGQLRVQKKAQLDALESSVSSDKALNSQRKEAIETLKSQISTFDANCAR